MPTWPGPRVDFLTRRRRAQQQQPPRKKLPMRDVVLAFRGTLSLQNLATDLNVKRDMLPSGYWGNYITPPNLRHRHLRGASATAHDEDLHEHAGAFAIMGQTARRTAQMATRFLSDLLHWNRPRLDSEGAHREAGQMYVELPSVRVHQGFWKAYQPLRHEALEAASKLKALAVREGIDLHFFLTGHSLGGALATLCAIDLKMKLDIDAHVYTYGCPRVGDHVFGRVADSICRDHFRLVHDMDMVTNMPKFIRMFKHSGSEVIIDRSGNIIIDPSWVEKALLPARRSIQDHQLGRYIAALDAAIQLRWGGKGGSMERSASLANLPALLDSSDVLRASASGSRASDEDSDPENARAAAEGFASGELSLSVDLEIGSDPLSESGAAKAAVDRSPSLSHSQSTRGASRRLLPDSPSLIDSLDHSIIDVPVAPGMELDGAPPPLALSPRSRPSS